MISGENSMRFAQRSILMAVLFLISHDLSLAQNQCDQECSQTNILFCVDFPESYVSVLPSDEEIRQAIDRNFPNATPRCRSYLQRLSVNYKNAHDPDTIDGQRNIGRAYWVRDNYNEALRWFLKAAYANDPEAQASAGSFYQRGLGVTEDYETAMHWYRLAAEQGNVDAQLELGFMYFRGQGVPTDYVQAHMWFNLADAGGGTRAGDARAEVEAKMTLPQINEAQRLAREWKPKSQ
jgi:tetratricopeptide (TPR) repeat protein